MHPVRKQRLTIVLFILFGASLAAGLVFYALSENMNLFYPPSDIDKAPIGKRIRIGGMVLEGSVQRVPNSIDVTFVVTDYGSNVTVHYNQILPDLFAEGQGIVAAGVLNDKGQFIADEVLAKHDENYTPSEVSATLKHREPQAGKKP